MAGGWTGRTLHEPRLPPASSPQIRHSLTWFSARAYDAVVGDPFLPRAWAFALDEHTTRVVLGARRRR
jgi:hypothetical protein